MAGAEGGGVARAVDAAGVGGAALLPPEVQPASMPSPSSADTVSVIALAGGGRWVLMMTELSLLCRAGRDCGQIATRPADPPLTFSERSVIASRENMVPA